MSVALVLGVSEGLGSALVRAFRADGLDVAGLSRRTPDPCLPMRGFRCDCTDPAAVDATVAEIEANMGPVDVLVHNAAAFSHGAFFDAPLEAFCTAWESAAKAAFVCAQRVLPGMVERGRGTVLFAGATASTRGSSKFAALASSKFALRGLAQSLAREFGPRGIHVGHVLVDGVIWCAWTRARFNVAESESLDPVAVAETFVWLHRQPRRAWTHELDLRPQGERF